MPNNTTYLGKIIWTTKTVGKRKYVYTEIRIKNKEALAKEFNVGDYVKVSLEKIHLTGKYMC